MPAGLVMPTHYWVPYIAETLGPEVSDLCAEAHYAPDPEQRLALDAIFGMRSDGLSAAFEILMKCGRQNIKTGTELQACIGWTMIREVRLVVYSAHNFTTAMETFRTAVEIFTGADILRKHVKKIVRNHGEESIEITPDPSRRITRTSRILFKTRTAGGGRGLSGNKVILDEAMFLKPAHMGALLPTMSAQPDPQVLYGSSAEMAESEVLRETTERGRAGGEPRLAMLEWCAPPPSETCEAGDRCTHSKTAVGCGCDKPDYWVYANPSLGKKRANGTGLTFEYVKAERRALPVSEFMRERMGWADVPSEGVSPIPMTTWVQCADKQSRVQPGSPLAIGIDIAPDSSSSAIGIAGWRADGKPHVEVAEHLPGTSWLVDRLMGIVERRDPVAVVMDPAAMAGAVERVLRNRGMEVVAEDKTVTPGKHRLVLASSRVLAQACTAFANEAANLELRHPDQEPLNLAVKGGRSRPVSQAWAWTPAAGADITPLVATTLARHGLEMHGKKPPPPSPFVLV